MDTPVRKLDFTQELERKAIKIIATDPGFVSYWIDRLQEVHFSFAWNTLIFKCVRNYYAKHSKLPTCEIIAQEVQKYLSPDDGEVAFYQYFQGIFSKDVVDEAEYIKNALVEHMKKVDYDQFIFVYAKKVQEGNYDDIKPAFEQMMKKHMLTTHEVGYMEAGETLVERVKEENECSPAIPSPWPTYNANNGGGFHPGTLSAFMGPTGSGKSIMLANVASHFIKAKKCVYYFTFELSRKKTMARIDVITSGATFHERKIKPQIVQEAIKAMKLGDLYVIEYPTDTCSANKIRATIDDYLSRGCKKPDVIIIDYLTIMVPNNKGDVDMKNEYAALKQVAEDVRGLAMDPAYGKPPIVTAFQANRGAEQKTAVGNEIKKGDIADSYAVMGVMDGVLSINQSVSEKQGGKLRLYAAKVRDAVDCYSITCDVKYECLQVNDNSFETQKYQNAIVSAQDQAREKGQIAVAYDPSAVTASMDLLLGTTLKRAGPQPVITFQDMSAAQAQVRQGPPPPPPPIGG